MKLSPEETAARVAASMAESKRKLAEATVNNAIGEQTIKLLRQQETVSGAELITAFEAMISERGGHSEQDLVVLQAEACINLLQSLRSKD